MLSRFITVKPIRLFGVILNGKLSLKRCRNIATLKREIEVEIGRVSYEKKKAAIPRGYRDARPFLSLSCPSNATLNIRSLAGNLTKIQHDRHPRLTVAFASEHVAKIHAE